MNQTPHRNSLTGVGFLMKRSLFPKGGSLLSLALWISVAGVALGVAMLMLVLAVMSGFLDFLQNKYTDITSPLVVIPRTEKVAGVNLKAQLEAIPGVEAVTPFGLSQAMLISNGVGGVTLEGISLSDSFRVTDWKRIWQEPPGESIPAEKNWIWIGKGLSEKLRIKSGDTVQLMLGTNPLQTVPFVVRAITKFGIHEHDLRYAYIDISQLQDLFFQGKFQPFFKMKLGAVSVNEAKNRIVEEFGDSVSVKKWSDINQNIFRAVKHQKIMLFWVLDIVVALAGMNVINLLMMSTYQRKRDVAILRAMGMRFKSIVFFFVGQGTLVGIMGIGSGVVLGFGLCHLVERFQPELLSEAIYNVTRLPLKVQLGDLILVCGAALFLCMVFSVIPALKAALSRPVQALRYE